MNVEIIEVNSKEEVLELIDDKSVYAIVESMLGCGYRIEPIKDVTIGQLCSGEAKLIRITEK